MKDSGVATAPVVVIGIAPAEREDVVGPFCDVIVPDRAAADELATAVGAQPTAAAAFVLFLRRAPGPSIVNDIVAESASYSALQASVEHQRWLDERLLRRDPRRDRQVVNVARHGERLDVVLSRPERRNAYSAQMRDGLLAALAVAAADPLDQ